MPQWNVIVTILPGGAELRFARRSLTIDEARTGRSYLYQPALESVEIPARKPGQSRSRIVVPTEFLNVPDLRDAGVLLGGASAEVALWQEGDDFKDRQILLTGRVEPNAVIRSYGKVTLLLSDYAQELNRRFPPYVVTTDGFPDVTANQRGRAMNVIYGGPATDVPVQLVDTYDDPDDPSSLNESVRFVVAGHKLTQASASVRGFGTDTFTAAIQEGFDHASGAKYSYFTLTPLQLQGASSITVDVFGHDRNGATITGLGDVVEHAITVYSGLTEERIDWNRMGDFVARANRLAVASVFGGDSNGTLMGLLSQRYGEPLGVRLDWQNGRFGPDLLSFDPFQKLGPPLRMGNELIERVSDIEYVTEGDSEPYSSFEVSYDPNMRYLNAIGNPAMNETARMDWTNDERCAEAYSRFGNVPFPLVETPDVNLAQSARVVLDWLADRYAVQRTRVSYRAWLSDVIRLPILRPYPVTDAGPQAGWTDQRMRLESVAPAEDDTAIVTLRSYTASI